jgi:hypothetical protein
MLEDSGVSRANEEGARQGLPASRIPAQVLLLSELGKLRSEQAQPHNLVANLAGSQYTFNITDDIGAIRVESMWFSMKSLKAP